MAHFWSLAVEEHFFICLAGGAGMDGDAAAGVDSGGDGVRVAAWRRWM